MAAMHEARAAHSGVVLPDGRVLVTGGRDAGFLPLSSVETYDPHTASWSQVANLKAPRRGHSTTRLADGRVLVAGGRQTEEYLSSVEVYDLQTDQWTPAAPLHFPRGFHSAIPLADGRVLVAGGSTTENASLAAGEVYDPASNAWALTPDLEPHRQDFTLTLLADGRVMLAGGMAGGIVTAEVIFYDPGKNDWSAAAPLQTARTGHMAILLPGGRVLVAGGHNADGTPLSSVEVYDVATNTWSNAADLNTARSGASVTLLSNGWVLAAGGTGSDNTTLASSEVYDPQADAWLEAGALQQARVGHVAQLLADGSVLVAGGQEGGGDPFSSAELFQLSTTATLIDLKAPTTITFGQPVAVQVSVQAASGSNAPGGTVNLQIDNGAVMTATLKPQVGSATALADFALSLLPGGDHMLQVSYPDRGLWLGSTASAALHVDRVPTIIILAVSGTLTTPGATSTLLATVGTSAGIPYCHHTGSITFFNGDQELGSAPIGSDCRAVLQVSNPGAGAHQIIASYPGDVSYLPVTSTALDVRVQGRWFLPLLRR